MVTFGTRFIISQLQLLRTENLGGVAFGKLTLKHEKNVLDFYVFVPEVASVKH